MSFDERGESARTIAHVSYRSRKPIMAIDQTIPEKLQIRLTSSIETILASLQPYAKWIEEMLGAPLSETLTLDVDCNPGDLVAQEFLQGLPVTSATKVRNKNWRAFIEGWALPPDVSPRIAMSVQRERQPEASPFA